MSDETESAMKIADRWAKEHPTTMCFVRGRLEFHLTEEEFVGLVRDVLALRSAGDGAADVERLSKAIEDAFGSYTFRGRSAKEEHLRLMEHVKAAVVKVVDR